MANRIISQTNFTAGHLSKRLHGQTGLEQYSAGLKKAVNCIVTPQGPIKKRPGTIFADYAGNPYESWVENEDPDTNNIPVTLIPFTTTTGINYLLEFGHDFIRVFRDGGVVTDVSDMITGITAADPGVVTSTAHNLSDGDLITITGVSGMTEVNNELFLVANSTANTFELNHPNGEGNFDTSNMTAYTSGGTAFRAFRIATTYETVTQIQYAQEGNKLYLAHPDHAPAILEYTGGNTGWTLTDLDAFPPPTEELGTQPATTVTPGATTGTGITFTAGASAFLQGDVGRQIVNLSGTGRAAITAYTSATQVVCTIVEDFPSTAAIAAADWELDLSPVSELTPDGTKVGSVINITSDDIGTTTALNTFRSGDVGKYIYLNGGIIQITEYVSASSVNGEVLKTLESKDESEIWTLEEPTWNSTRGYPSAVAFYEDRLWFGGTIVEPSTVWASETSLYDAFGIGSNDSDAISVQINSSRTAVIKWLAGSRDLVVGTDNSEITINSGSQGPITPSSIRQTPRTYTGSDSHQPVIIDNEVLYIQDDKVRSFRYDFNIDNFRSQDLTFLADDLFKGKTLTKIVFAQDPDSVIYVLASDGTLYAGTFVREQRVMGWTKFETAGKFKDIQVISNGSVDELWCVTIRQTNRTDLPIVWGRFIEYFDSDVTQTSGTVYTDCSLKLNSVVVNQSDISFIRKTDIDQTREALSSEVPDYIDIDFITDLTTLGLSTGDYSVLIENCEQFPALNGVWNASYNSITNEFHIDDDNSNIFSEEKDWAFDKEYDANGDGTIINPSSINITINKVSSFSGLNHLGHWYVNVKGDSAEFPEEQVSQLVESSGQAAGDITLDSAVHQAAVGIKYTMEMETLPLDIGSGSESFQNRTMRRSDLLLRVHDSVRPTVNGNTIAHRDPDTPMNVASPLVTGVLNYGPLDWSSTATVTITDSSPLPIQINGIYSHVEVNRKA